MEDEAYICVCVRTIVWDDKLLPTRSMLLVTLRVLIVLAAMMIFLNRDKYMTDVSVGWGRDVALVCSDTFCSLTFLI